MRLVESLICISFLSFFFGISLFLLFPEKNKKIVLAVLVCVFLGLGAAKPFLLHVGDDTSTAAAAVRVRDLGLWSFAGGQGKGFGGNHQIRGKP